MEFYSAIYFGILRVMPIPIVLIRGLFRNKFHWGDFLDDLQSTFPYRKIICLDIAGNGENYQQKSAIKIDAMVEDLRYQLKKANKIDLIAMSMGGMIALKWAELYPKEINAIVCINTSAANYSPFYQRLLPRQYCKLLYATLTSLYNRELTIYNMVSNKTMDLNVINYWVKLAENYPVSIANFYRQLFAALSFRVININTDVLFISSQKDQLVSSKASEMLAVKYKKPLIKNIYDGHDIALDNPKWLCEQLFRWLDKLN